MPDVSHRASADCGIPQWQTRQSAADIACAADNSPGESSRSPIALSGSHPGTTTTADHASEIASDNHTNRVRQRFQLPSDPLGVLAIDPSMRT
jgi:hypothetical protein